MTYEIVKQFGFEAAHHFTHMPEGHGYKRMHGHSYQVEVAIEGAPDEATGWIADFAELESSFADLKAELDHNTLNDVKGLENPSLENISRWIAEGLKARYPGLAWVRVKRPSCGESCTYRP